MNFHWRLLAAVVGNNDDDDGDDENENEDDGKDDDDDDDDDNKFCPCLIVFWFMKDWEMLKEEIDDDDEEEKKEEKEEEEKFSFCTFTHGRTELLSLWLHTDLSTRLGFSSSGNLWLPLVLIVSRSGGWFFATFRLDSQSQMERLIVEK